MAALQAEGEKVRERNAVLACWRPRRQYLGAAQTLYRLSVERPKNDLDREAGYQERDWGRIRESLGAPAADDRPDGATARSCGGRCGKAAALPAGQRIEPLDKAVGLRAGHGHG